MSTTERTQEASPRPDRCPPGGPEARGVAPGARPAPSPHLCFFPPSPCPAPAPLHRPPGAEKQPGQPPLPLPGPSVFVLCQGCLPMVVLAACPRGPSAVRVGLSGGPPGESQLCPSSGARRPLRGPRPPVWKSLARGRWRGGGERCPAALAAFLPPVGPGRFAADTKSACSVSR